MNHFGYFTLIHKGAAELGVNEYIGETVTIATPATWEKLKFFDPDASFAVLIGLFETLRDKCPPFATFWGVGCGDGLYRFPTETEKGVLRSYATETIPNRSSAKRSS